MTNPVSIEMAGENAWITIDHPPANATATAVRLGLMDATPPVQSARLAVLRCTGVTTDAGGDMSEYAPPAQEPHLPDVVNALEARRNPRSRRTLRAHFRSALRKRTPWAAERYGLVSIQRQQPHKRAVREVEALIKVYSAEAGITRRSFAPDGVKAQLLAAMTNEGARPVEEGGAESAATVDVVKIAGHGFPRHRGGHMHRAEDCPKDALDAASASAWSRAAKFSDI